MSSANARARERGKSFEGWMGSLFWVLAPRTPLSGGNSRHTRSDTLSKELCIEAKSRAKLALWSLYEKVKAIASKERKIPVIAQKEVGRHGALVTIHTDDVLAFARHVLAMHERQQEPDQ